MNRRARLQRLLLAIEGVLRGDIDGAARAIDECRKMGIDNVVQLRAEIAGADYRSFAADECLSKLEDSVRSWCTDAKRPLILSTFLSAREEVRDSLINDRDARAALVRLSDDQRTVRLGTTGSIAELATLFAGDSACDTNIEMCRRLMALKGEDVFVLILEDDSGTSSFHVSVPPKFLGSENDATS
jgi:hypothetical protein